MEVVFRKPVGCEQFLADFQKVQEAVRMLLDDVDKKNKEKLRDRTLTPGVKGFRILDFQGRQFYVVISDLFSKIFEGSLIEKARTKHPELFNTGTPEDVLNALLKTVGYDYFEPVEEIRQTEYLGVTDDNGKKVLLLPSFRVIEDSEFKDSFFHLLKHFSIDGGAGSSTFEGGGPEFDISVIANLVYAFFNSEPAKIKKKPPFKIGEKTYTDLILEYLFVSGDDQFKAILFYSERMEITFISTIYKIS